MFIIVTATISTFGHAYLSTELIHVSLFLVFFRFCSIELFKHDLVTLSVNLEQSGFLRLNTPRVKIQLSHVAYGNKL